MQDGVNVSEWKSRRTVAKLFRLRPNHTPLPHSCTHRRALSPRVVARVHPLAVAEILIILGAVSLSWVNAVVVIVGARSHHLTAFRESDEGDDESGRGKGEDKGEDVDKCDGRDESKCGSDFQSVSHTSK